MPELKPCECGSKNITEYQNRGDYHEWAIICEDCGRSTYFYHSIEEAWKAWNTKWN